MNRKHQGRSRRPRKQAKVIRIHTIEALERRQLLASNIQITVEGEATAREGDSYALNYYANVDVQSWDIDWGDGATTSTPGFQGRATHTYIDGPAWYQPTVTATDYDGVAHTVEFAQPGGEPDPSFEINGWRGDSYYVSGVAQQSDGKILIGASTGPAMIVRRFTSGGDYDRFFGQSGIATADVTPGNDVARAVAVAPDGKIVVAGIGSDGGAGAARYLVLARFNQNGTLDTSFRFDGKITNPLVKEIQSLLVQPDGKIVIGGYKEIIRYNANGTIDTSFGNEGVADVTLATPFGSGMFIDALAVQSDGSILAAGTIGFGNRDTARGGLLRLNSNGTADTSFGDGGAVVADLPGGYDQVKAMLLLRDGHVVIAGSTQMASTNHDFVLRKYRPDGSADDSFGDHGQAVTDLTGGDDHVLTLALQPDNRILAGGSAAASWFVKGGGLARYNPDGSLDSSFADAGTMYFNDVQNYELLEGIVLQPDRFVTVVEELYSTTLRRYTIGERGVSVLNVLPDLTVDVPTSAKAGQPVSVGLNASDPGDDSVVWEIDWGDGSPLVTTGAASAQHTYLETGERFVKIRALDEDGQNFMFSRFIQVSLRAPQLVAGTLTIYGTGAGDLISLDSSSGPLVVKVGQESWSFPAGDVEDVRLRTGGGWDSLDLRDGDYTFEADAFDNPRLALTAGTLDPQRPGEIVFKAPHRLGLLWVDAPIKIAPGGGNTLSVDGILVREGKTIDLADNSLIIRPPDDVNDFAWVRDYIRSARNSPNGTWKGWGITSSAARSTPNTTLAFMRNPGLIEFKGHSIRPQDFLVAYTYNGDANLDGVITSDDYFRIDSGFLAQPANPTYAQGDFNYDGAITSDDYVLIDSAFLGPRAPTTSAVAAAAASPLVSTRPAPPRNQPPASDRIDPRRKSVRRGGLFSTARSILD